jgi:hypothetical protein
MTAIHMVWAWVHSRVQRVRAEPERGDIVQTAIIVGLFAAAAIVVVGILVAKATDAANNVKTQ